MNFLKRIQILKKTILRDGGMGWVGEGGGGARVSDFFSKNPNLKKKNFFRGGKRRGGTGDGGVGKGAGG